MVSGERDGAGERHRSAARRGHKPVGAREGERRAEDRVLRAARGGRVSVVWRPQLEVVGLTETRLNHRLQQVHKEVRVLAVLTRLCEWTYKSQRIIILICK